MLMMQQSPSKRHRALGLAVGTAFVESFEELLDAIGQMGATRVQIGQFEEGG
jgi:hypothetical protein